MWETQRYNYWLDYTRDKFSYSVRNMQTDWITQLDQQLKKLN